MNLPAPVGLPLTERDSLADLAIATIRVALTERRTWEPHVDDVPGAWWEPGVTFVTLERGDELLGCVGGLEASDPLACDVARRALGAAFGDPRLPAIDCDDFETMSVKVSVLSSVVPIDADSTADLAARVRPGVDGLVVQCGFRRATFLPAVWPKVASVDEFLTLLWRKAGLAPGSWPQGTCVSRYTTEEHRDAGPRRVA